MGGDRIDAAKEALLLLLKSLPVGCSFNVVSFGSSHELLFPEGSSPVTTRDYRVFNGPLGRSLRSFVRSFVNPLTHCSALLRSLTHLPQGMVKMHEYACSLCKRVLWEQLRLLLSLETRPHR